MVIYIYVYIYIYIWRFHFLVHLLESYRYLVVQRALFCSSPASSSTTPPRLQGATSVRRRAWADGRVQLFFLGHCPPYSYGHNWEHTQKIKKNAGKYGRCVKHICFSFSSHWTYGCHQHEKNHILRNWHFFPKKNPHPIRLAASDVARELTFPSLASLIACLSPEPGERSDVYSVSREISQREILKTEGVGFFLLMECVVFQEFWEQIEQWGGHSWSGELWILVWPRYAWTEILWICVSNALSEAALAETWKLSFLKFWGSAWSKNHGGSIVFF